MVKSPLADAGDTGPIPGLGGSHMPQSSYAHVPQLGSLGTLGPVLCHERRHLNDTSARHGWRVAPARSN